MNTLALLRRARPWLLSAAIVLAALLLMPGGRAKLHTLLTPTGREQAAQALERAAHAAASAARSVHREIVQGEARTHEWHASARWLRFIAPGAHYGTIEPARVLRVIDGDTLDALWRGRRVRVRLIGVDALEAHDNPKLHRDADELGLDPDTMLRIGHAARDYLARLLPQDAAIGLSFPNDAPRTDAYGRLLAYVHMPDGHVANEVLLREGVARARFLPRDGNAAVYLSIEAEARRKKRGIWAVLR